MAAAVICTTLLIEKSPQALPLGAACIASAVKNALELKGKVDVSLKAFCLEDKDFPKDKSAAFEYIAGKLLETAADADNAIFCFSCFVWNIGLLENASKILRESSGVLFE